MASTASDKTSGALQRVKADASALSGYLRTYGPANWPTVVQFPQTAYTADAPPLRFLERFSPEGPRIWIKTQVLALFFSSNNADKNTVDSIDTFAGCLAADLAQYKLTELMLFFARYKSGRYDNSYASFDSRRIGHAFFKEFLPERRAEIERIMRRIEQERITQRAWSPPQGYTSLSWYEHCKKEAAMGNKAILKPPTA